MLNLFVLFGDSIKVIWEISKEDLKCNILDLNRAGT